MTKFGEFEFAALDLKGRNSMNRYTGTTCSFSFGKIITLIYTDCDYLNNKLYFVVSDFSFSTIYISF